MMEVEKLVEETVIDKKEEKTPSFLEELIGTRAKLRTFEFLLEHPTYDYTIQDIHKYTGLSRLSVANALKIFMKYGMVTITRRIGRAEFYQINMENPIVEAFLELHFKLAKILLNMER